MKVSINPACWAHYGTDALLSVLRANPGLFGQYQQDRPAAQFNPWQVTGRRYTDSWGCLWETSVDGMTGAVIEHPLADWSALADFQPPNPDEHWGWGPIDWQHQARRLAKQRQGGGPAIASLRHGHTFLTLTYLRGYENAILDMADDDPRLGSLLAMIEDFNTGLVQRFLDCGATWIGYPEDLGMQTGPMLSPDQFRRYIKPIYRRLMQPAREAGAIIHMHSDGDIRSLADDLVDVGVDVLNIQDQVDGLEWIAENLKGRLAIDLDITRQTLTPSGTPKQIRDHIDRAIDLLAEPAGGLILRYDLNPGIPVESMDALFDRLAAEVGG